MGFSDFITTREGHLAIAENLAGGGVFSFVEIVLGDGKITTQAPEALTEVISPIHTVTVASAELKQGVTTTGETANYVLIKVHFKTTDIGTSFYFREIGVMAQVGDGVKRMVAYNNAYDLADYIDVTAAETQDRTLAIPVYVGSVSDIAIQISEDMTYLSIDEFEAHKDDPTAHLPVGGEVGQVLIKTKDGFGYDDVNKVKVTPVLVTLPVDGWSNNIQTVNVEGVTADNIVFVSSNPATRAEYGSAMVACTAQAEGTLTFECDSTPETDLTLNIVIWEV